jgi:hypothetical protein
MRGEDCTNSDDLLYLGTLLCVGVKSGCIFKTFTTICEFGTFIRIIDDLRVSIDFYFNEDARLSSGLLESPKKGN